MYAQYMQAPTKEVRVSKRIRQTHRWLSIIFTATVIANFVAMALTASSRRPIAHTHVFRLAQSPFYLPISGSISPC